MADAAKAAGYDVLGFSSHAPFAHGGHWAMRAERLLDYVREVRRLSEAWGPGGERAGKAGPMEVLLGLEVDWFPDERRPGDGAFAGLGLDYILGSVHFVDIEGAGPFTVDANEADFDKGLGAIAEAISSGRREAARLVYEDYYRRLGAMIDDGGFDILGHLDLVKKNNVDYRVFDEREKAYLDAAFAAVSRLKGRDIVVEVNLGGMARGKTKEPYPSLDIMRELKRIGARITFTADAHSPEHLGAHIDAARGLAREAGYECVHVLSGGRWVETELDRT